jgi:hypothetical protein
MVATRASKRALAQIRNPLEAGILQRVLSYVGPGQYLLLAAVSKEWKLCYEQAAPAEMKRVLFDTNDICTAASFRPFLCAAKMTLYSAVFASAECLQFVVDSKVQVGRSGLYDRWDDRVHRSMGYFADLQTLQLAQKLGCTISSETMVGAAMSGSLAKVQWLHRKQRQQLYARVFHAAAKRLRWPLMRWLVKQRCPFDADGVCGHTLEGGAGSIELLQWLKQHGARYTEDTMMEAAGAGRLDVVKFLHSEQCPCDEEACDRAAVGGHLDVLQWLFEQGCPHLEGIWSAAARNGHIAVMAFLFSVIPELSADPRYKTVMLKTAGAHSKLAAAQWLHAQGAQWPAVLSGYNSPWQGEVLAWARAEGCTAPTEYPDVAEQ